MISAEATLGDDWAAIKKNAGDAYKADHPDDSLAKLAEAKSIYQNSFANAALMHDPTTHDIIMDLLCRLRSTVQHRCSGRQKTGKTEQPMS